MIARIWHGRTTPANAEPYEELLKSKVFPDINDRQIRGFRSVHLLRRDMGEEVEYITIMWFDSWEGVREFAGEDYEVAVVLPEAHALLIRYDAHSQHYETRAASGWKMV